MSKIDKKSFISYAGMSIKKDHVLMYANEERNALIAVHKKDVVQTLLEGGSFALYFPILDQ